MDNYHGEVYGQFHLALPIQKSYSVTENGETKMVVAGVASGTSTDLEADRMTAAAINAFQKAVEHGIVDNEGVHSLIPLRTGHRKEWSDVLGWVTKATVDENSNLWIEAELDETSSVARDLFHKLRVGSRPGKPLKLGFSVGGFITKARNEYDSALKKTVRVIEDVLLDEISVVGSPAFAPSFVDVLTKSTRWDEVPTYYQGENSMNLLEAAAQAKAEYLAKLPPVEATAETLEKNEAVDVATARVAEENPQPNDNVNTDNAAVVDAAAAAATAPAENAAPVGVVADGNAVDPVADEEAAREAAADAARAAAAEANPSADASSESGALKELQNQVRALQDSVAQLLAAQQNVTSQVQPVQKTETPVEEVTPDVLTKGTQDFVAEAVTNALIAFKTEYLDPMVQEISLVKSTVEEVAKTPIDKSISVEAARTPVSTTVEDFRKRLSANGGKISPIRASVEASLNRNAQE